MFQKMGRKVGGPSTDRRVNCSQSLRQSLHPDQVNSSKYDMSSIIQLGSQQRGKVPGHSSDKNQSLYKGQTVKSQHHRTVNNLNLTVESTDQQLKKTSSRTRETSVDS